MRWYMEEGEKSYHENNVFFCVATLEFIFVSAELIEMGWNIENWLGRPNTGTHMLGVYVREYPKLFESFMEEVRRVYGE